MRFQMKIWTSYQHWTENHNSWTLDKNHKQRTWPASSSSKGGFVCFNYQDGSCFEQQNLFREGSFDPENVAAELLLLPLQNSASGAGDPADNREPIPGWLLESGPRSLERDAIKRRKSLTHSTTFIFINQSPHLAF